LDKSENLVFEVNGYILRLTEDRHRTVSQLEAELYFIAALSDQGIAVATPILSTNNIYVETIQGHHFSLFKKARGVVKNKKEVFSSLKASRNIGRALGMMHAFTVDYKLEKNKRHHISEVAYHTNGADFIHKDDHLALNEFDKAIQWSRRYLKGTTPMV